MKKYLYFDKVVFAACKALLPKDHRDNNAVSKVSDFVLSSIRISPFYLRIPFYLGLLMIDWSCILVSLKLFHNSKLSSREKYLNSRLVARCGPLTKLIEAIRSLALLAYYDLDETWARIEYYPRKQVLDAIKLRESKVN